MSNKGYILKDYLLGITVFVLLFPIIIKSAEIISNLKYIDKTLNDEIAILQLRRKMIIAQDIEINNNILTFRIYNEEFNLKYNDRRLYLTPGYQLYLDDTNYFTFEIEGDMIFIKYEKDDEIYKRFISFK